MTIVTVDPGTTTVDVLKRKKAQPTLYVKTARGYLYRGRHRHRRARPSHAAVARIAAALILAALVLSYAALGALSMWTPS